MIAAFTDDGSNLWRIHGAALLKGSIYCIFIRPKSYFIQFHSAMKRYYAENFPGRAGTPPPDFKKGKGFLASLAELPEKTARNEFEKNRRAWTKGLDDSAFEILQRAMVRTKCKVFPVSITCKCV